MVNQYNFLIYSYKSSLKMKLWHNSAEFSGPQVQSAPAHFPID